MKNEFFTSILFRMYIFCLQVICFAGIHIIIGWFRSIHDWLCHQAVLGQSSFDRKNSNEHLIKENIMCRAQ